MGRRAGGCAGPQEARVGGVRVGCRVQDAEQRLTDRNSSLSAVQAVGFRGPSAGRQLSVTLVTALVLAAVSTHSGQSGGALWGLRTKGTNPGQ